MTDRSRTSLATALVLVATIVALYWILWFTDRSLLASETRPAYYEMDFLYDAEHGIWTRGAGGAIEAVINAATLAINVGLLWWTWRRRRGLGAETA